MPVEFLSDEQAARYGRYHADPSPEQLARFFYLSPQDLRFLADYRRSYTRLGGAVQLGTLRFLGTFLPVPTLVPVVVVHTLAQQLHLTADSWSDQYTRPNTLHDHQVQVVAYLGFRPFDGRQAFRLTRWLYAQVLTSTVRPSVLFDLATPHLLAYVHDEAYRRRLLVQLNRGEGRHALARAVFHGKKGELRQRYREGMEDQLGALGLVVNALVLWNTRYLQQAFERWQETEEYVNREDVARLSPLLHEHVNMLGRYDFTLPEAVAAGQLRPLRTLTPWEASLGEWA